MPAHQQSVLNGIDRALESRDPRLASIFAIFTGLTRDDGPPRTERLARAPNAVLNMLRAAIRRARAAMRAAALRARASAAMRRARASAVIPIVLVAGLMAAIVALGVATSGGAVCRSAASTNHGGQSRTALCRATANGAVK